MSTREQRRAWQDFREKHGVTREQFHKKFRAMFNRDPTSSETAQFETMKRELRAPLGRARRAFDPDTTPVLDDYTTKVPIVTVTRRFEWDMGHRLPNHHGKCSRLHGHRYVAEVDVTGPLATSGSSEGMVVDFAHMDDVWSELHRAWDHRTMLHVGDPLLSLGPDAETGAILRDYGVFTVSFVPTAENIAREILRWLSNARQPHVTRVRVYETPRAWAEVKA